MAKKYIVERDEETDLLQSVKIKETKEIITEINIAALIREKKENLDMIERLKNRNKEIVVVLKDIDQNTELSVTEIADDPNILK